METLATNSEKAALVCFLIIEYTCDNINKNQRVTTYLSKSLINMRSLSDLRVRAHPNDLKSAEMIYSLAKILWSVSKMCDLLETNDSAGDTVKIIFDYMLFTATTFSTYLKSLRVKPICKYLDYISADVETPW